MARVTVEDCLDHVDNRFELVIRASKRARDLSNGGVEPLLDPENDKDTVIALRELAEGLLSDEAVMAQQLNDMENNANLDSETPDLS